jgi:putative transcriptional regulator
MSALWTSRPSHRFDVKCLTPVRPLSPKQILALRLRKKASQAVLARYLELKSDSQ